MNKLSPETQAQILHLLVEGNSIRGTVRLTGVSKNTIMSLFTRAGKACLRFHSQTVKQLVCKRVQCDEQWAFVYSKDKNTKERRWGVGSVWLWVALDPDSKLVISYFAGERTDESAKFFMNDLWCRVRSRIQLSTDGLSSYREAVADTFGGKIDFAQAVKNYTKLNKNGKETTKEYYNGTEKRVISGNPEEKHISTSYLEKLNSTTRMHSRRFIRETTGFSKKYENHCYAIALHFMYYNFIKKHQSIKTTPAIRAGVVNRSYTMHDLVKMCN
jgi:IS1 family transposase